jgi:hypothetical protein
MEPISRADADADADPRIAAFCSPERPEVFHAIAYRNDIWKDDPFDVETIHEEARATFERLVRRAAQPSGAAAGRILLLEGEAGSGKTHLLRAFRNATHSRGRGYYGYMQMTSATSHYGRYVLNNLVDSLDQPYFEPAGETTGLLRLSNAVAESGSLVALDRLDPIRSGELDHECLARLVEALADQIVMDDRFNTIDLDLIRALLFLQSNDPRIKGRVLKFLRCEDLSASDRTLLGGLVPRTYDDAPQWLIQHLGKLMDALESLPLILCVDQLEDIYNLDDAEARFRRAMATFCDLASRIPNVVIVIACLEDFYKLLKARLTKPITDRIENDPAPIRLKGQREEDEVVAMVAQRLRFLDDVLGAPFREDEPTFPFPPALLKRLVGMRTRDVLQHCQDYRERCIVAGRLLPIDGTGPVVVPPGPPDRVDPTPLEQAWNDFRTAFAVDVPTADEELAALLAGAIRTCGDEFEAGPRFEAEPDGRMLRVESPAAGNTVGQILVGVCNANAQGGRLGKQVAEVVERAGAGQTPVLVRSTTFPSNPRTAVARQIGTLIAGGGRRAVVGDSDWRTMMALPPFREQHRNDPAFTTWLRQSRPLSLLKSLRTILDLDQPRTEPPPSPPSPPPSDPDTPASPPVVETPATPQEPPLPGDAPGPILLGTTNDRAAGPVTLDPQELTRHAALLGGPGSGKTTIALNLIEELLLRGVPALLVDRKGDLCGYARAASWERPLADPEQEARRARLRAAVDVAVYTPGEPRGRPLSITLVPAGLGRLGAHERGQVARYAAAALAGMMNYGPQNRSDQARQVILASAIDLLAQDDPDGTVTLGTLIDAIGEQDPALVNVVGRLDLKLFDKLVNDLETLRLSRGEFLAAPGEPLDPPALLGLGRHARPGKTRLSVISTKFLGATQDIQFWVAQLLVALGRWASQSPAPAGRLQAVFLFDEADLYLPAQRQPPTKEPMENLLRRARAAGLGFLLATQSPGDFDYKCRDNIRAWFLGRIKEPTALAKMKPMLNDCRVDVAARLPGQETGEFHLIRDGHVSSLSAAPSVMATEQLPEQEILELARGTSDEA